MITYKYMYVMGPVSYSELRQRLATHLDAVSDSGAPLVITRQGGKPPLVLMPLSEFEGWQETAHLLKSPANAARLLRSIRDAEDGKLLKPDIEIA
jgi:antitoxin YefM